MARVRNPGAQRAQAIAVSRRRRGKRRRSSKIIHYTLLMIFVITAGLVLCLTTLFKIKQVTAVGTDKYIPGDIVDASGIQVEENLLRIDAAAAEENILTRFPYIESVRIRRRLPATVEIQLTQSVPGLAVLEEGKVTLLTREGKVLEGGDLFIPSQVPVVKGLAVTGVPPGQTLGEESAEGLKMLRYLFDALEHSEFGDITNVDITDRLNMKIVYENRILLLLGTESDLPYKLDMLHTVIASKPPDAQGRIDATNIKEKRVVFKNITLEEALASPDKADTNPDEPSGPGESQKEGGSGEDSLPEEDASA